MKVFFKLSYVIVFAVLFGAGLSYAQSEYPLRDGVEISAQDSESSVDNSVNFSRENENLYRLGPDDTLKITVFGENDLSDTYTVSANGMISMPLIGSFAAADKTLSEVQGHIEAKLADGFLVNPSVSIEISSYRPFFILGEVRTPGRYNYEADVTVLKAVALAGGFTYRANKKEVKILKSLNDGTSMYEEMPVNSTISPGDIILVKERFF